MVLALHDGIRGDYGRGARDGDHGGDLRRAAAPDEQGFETGQQAAQIGAAQEPALRGLRRLLEPRGERPSSAEDERLDRTLRELELGGDLAIRQSLPLTQENRAALALGHLLEHALQPDQLVGGTRRRRSELLDRLEVGRRLDASAPPAGAAAREADVVRDLEKPGRLELRDDAP